MGYLTDAGQTTVLVVDDDPDCADVYEGYLNDDYAVRTAYSGEEALELLDEDVAAVLLDRRMPGLSGDEVLSAVRDSPFDCRVIMVTAMPPEVETLNNPFDDYLVKPVSGDGIRDAVERMLVRNACDETIQRIVTVAGKMATLEAKMTVTELEASTAYTALENQLAELRASSAPGADADAYVEFTDDKLASLLG